VELDIYQIKSGNSDLSDNYRMFDRLVSHAENLLRRSELESAAAFGQIAAECAWRNHAGLLSSLRLEGLLQQIAQNVATPILRTRRLPRINRPIKRVLHVITQAYGIGGHTRMAWRWIKSDSSRVHSIALTRQGTHRVPEELMEASILSGGEIYRIDFTIGNLIARAAALRCMAQQFDTIVLHVHPYDVLPIIGLSHNNDRPPIVFMNHADHAFWLGTSISDIVAHFRYSGVQLSVKRRALEHSRCVILPIPILSAKRTLTKIQAKRKLCLSEKDIVLLSIASAYKYKSYKGASIIEATVPILEKIKNAVLLFVGPDKNDLPAAATASVADRIHLYGKRDDNMLFYQAADICLDSFPFSSITSLLEAGSLGIPLASYCMHPPSSEVLCADDPGLIRSLVRLDDTLSYQKAIIDLINSTESRERLGHQTREEICTIHERQWHTYLESLYAQAISIEPLQWSQPGVDRMIQDELDQRLLRLHTEGGMTRPVSDILRSHYRLLPFKTRLNIWIKTRNTLIEWIPDFLFSDRMFTRLKKILVGWYNAVSFRKPKAHSTRNRFHNRLCRFKNVTNGYCKNRNKKGIKPATTISIAIATFNGEEFIEQQLASLIGQLRQPDELVVIDDHSSDRTVELATRVSKKSAIPIRVFTNASNLGVTKNFERAVSICTGCIIALCDQDDVWLPDKLLRIEAEFTHRPQIGMVFSNGLIVDRHLAPMGYTLWDAFKLSKAQVEQVANGDASEVLLKHFFVTGATLAFRRELLRHVLPFPAIWSHDAWISCVLSHVTAIAPVSQPLIWYRQHGSNQIGASNDFRSRFIRPWTRDQGPYFRGQVEMFKALYHHLEDRGLATQFQLDRVSEKLRHLTFRKKLPSNRLLRAPYIIRSLLRGEYDKYSRHRWTAMRDLLSTRQDI
jgi:glycosyltransferase involved in cell wall biosynthesis